MMISEVFSPVHGEDITGTIGSDSDDVDEDDEDDSQQHEFKDEDNETIDRDSVTFGFENSSQTQLGTHSCHSLSRRGSVGNILENTSTDDDEENKSTMMASVINLSNTIVGSGCLALPYAFAASGYVLGFFFLIVFGTLSTIGLHLLSSCVLKVGLPSNFRAVTTAALPGGTWSVLIDIAVALKCFGVATSYLIVFADSLPLVMEQLLPSSMHSNSFIFNRQLWVLIGSCFACPLCFLSSFEKLKFTSTLSLFFVFFLTFLIFIAAIHPSLIQTERDDDLDDLQRDDQVRHSLIQTNGNTFSQVSVFIFAFTCQQNVFSISNELKAVSQKRVDIVTSSSIFVAFSVYFVIAVSGYTYFGKDVSSDVLTSFGEHDPMVVTARLCVALLVCFSYPLQCYPSCMCLDSIISNSFPDFYKRERCMKIQKVITSGFVTLSIMVALVVSNLGVVLAVVGATGSTMVCFVIPGACYFRLFPFKHCMWYLAVLQFSLGVMIIPIALTGIALYS